jgi:hypothetical protein
MSVASENQVLVVVAGVEEVEGVPLLLMDLAT